MKNKSLRSTLMFVFSLILILVVISNILINSWLLPRVYQDNKIKAMKDFYREIYEQYSTGGDDYAVISLVKSVLSTENIRVFVWDSNDMLIIDSLPLSRYDEDNDTPEEPSPAYERQGDETVRSRGNSQWQRNNPFFFEGRNNMNIFNGRNERFIYYMNISQEDIVAQGDDYTIFSIVSNNFSASKEDYDFYLRGTLPNDYKVLLQMPFSSIDEAVKISNTLLMFVGMIMLLFGIIVVAFTSKTIAKPVKELSDIASSMEKLDFSRQYVHNRRDEIGSLGDSINSLSSKLESTINELYEKNEKLKQDIELKNRIDNMRKEFIANASHELKTPVALISGYAEGLRDNVAGDEDSRRLYTDVIIEEAGRMDNIIRQMLDLMEIEGSEKVVDGTEFSLFDLVVDVANSFNLLIKGADIKLTLNSQGDTVIYGEYWRIYQAVSNYLSNAINHVNDKKIIDVWVKEDKDFVVLSVYNSGVPIPEEDIENLWERFYKVDKSHTREYGGTGLGLSIVRSIVQLHKGEYGVKNHPDGAEFYFSIKKEKHNEN